MSRYLSMGVIFFRGSDKTRLSIFHIPKVTQIDIKVDFITSCMLASWSLFVARLYKGPFLLSYKGIIIQKPHKSNFTLIAFLFGERKRTNFIKFSITCASFWNRYHDRELKVLILLVYIFWVVHDAFNGLKVYGVLSVN